MEQKINMKNNFTIVLSNSIKVLDNGDLEIVTTDGLTGICSKKEISDYTINDVESYFNTFLSYKFKVISVDKDNFLNLSYKQCHPKLYKNKHKIIPTANHYKTLRRNVYLDMQSYFKK